MHSPGARRPLVQGTRSGCRLSGMTHDERSALKFILEKLRKAEGCADPEKRDVGGVIAYLIDARQRLAKVLGIDDDSLPPKR